MKYAAWAGVTAAVLWGCAGLRADDVAKPHVVILVGEDEYDAARTVPAFAAEHLARDYRVTCLVEDPQRKYHLPGIEAVKDADVLVVYMRRRPLPPAELDLVRQYVAAGKPVVGIRTACHAFSLNNKPAPEGLADWPGFDPEVLGGHYVGHHKAGPTTAVCVADGAAGDPLLKGVDPAGLASTGTLYKVRPLAASTRPLLIGSIPGEPAEPVAWTNRRADGGPSFFTTLGHADDFKHPAFVRLLTNAVAWAAEAGPASSDQGRNKNQDKSTQSIK